MYENTISLQDLITMGYTTGGRVKLQHASVPPTHFYRAATAS